jgi:hypothetical protein
MGLSKHHSHRKAAPVASSTDEQAALFSGMAKKIESPDGVRASDHERPEGNSDRPRS